MPKPTPANPFTGRRPSSNRIRARSDGCIGVDDRVAGRGETLVDGGQRSAVPLFLRIRS